MTLPANILGSIGPAPESLAPAERTAWDEILGHALPGAYTESDRGLIEIAARNLAKYRESGSQNSRLAVGLVLLFQHLCLPSDAVVQLMASDAAPSPSEASS